MRWTFRYAGLAAILSLRYPARPIASPFNNDPETGFTFSQYQVVYSLPNKHVTIGIAVPSTAQQNQQYDPVIQMSAPTDIGWVGFAWGGSMSYNPLTVSWANSGQAVVSSRYSTLLKTGTRSNNSQWQVTAKCSGCTSFSGSSGSQRYLNPKGGNRFAFVYSKQRPSNPSSASSSFSVHENVFVYWTHDFSMGQNQNFDDLVTKNGGTPSAQLGKKRIVAVEADIVGKLQA
ncbi:hypothetical protein GE09DRAFT_1199191 [Coniochaeta sp. 2T2.1]|nr:hypothetical protein GE09DRAFT_1199191 [Coniochaeta sp. 2T2.1]